jgi:hypothetical protein
MSEWEEYVAALGQVTQAREGVARQQSQSGLRAAKAKEAASSAVADADVRRQYVEQQAARLEQFAAQTLDSAGVHPQGRRDPITPPKPATADEARGLIDRMGVQLTHTADQLRQARAEHQARTAVLAALPAYLGVPLLGAAWVLWVDGTIPEAVSTVVLASLAMLTVRKATEGIWRPLSVTLTAVVGIYALVCAVSLFKPAVTGVFFAMVLVAVAGAYLSLVVRDARRAKQRAAQSQYPLPPGS